MTDTPAPFRMLARFSALAISLVLTGCASSYFVKVRSERSEQLDSALHYYLTHSNQHPLQDDLYEEAGAELRAEFFEIGMIEATEPEAAQIIVQYQLGITEHVEEKVRYRGAVPALRTDLRWRPGTQQSRDGKYLIGENTTRTDFGKEEKELKVVAYEKQITLSAWDAPTVLQGQHSDENRVWRAQASVTDAGTDFFMILPYLSNAVVAELSSKSSDSEPQYVKYKSRYDKPDPYALIFSKVKESDQ